MQPGCVEVPKKRSLASTPRAPEAQSNCTRCQQSTGPYVDFCQNTAVWNAVVGTCGTVRGGVAWRVKVHEPAIARCWRSRKATVPEGGTLRCQITPGVPTPRLQGLT